MSDRPIEHDVSPVAEARAADAPSLRQPSKGGPRYRVLRKCFLHSVGLKGPRAIEPGDEEEFLGAPGAALLPLTDPARAARLQTLLDVDLERVTGKDLADLAFSLGLSPRNGIEGREMIAGWIFSETAKAKP